MIEFSWGGILSAVASPQLSVVGTIFFQVLGVIGAFAFPAAAVALVIGRDTVDKLMIAGVATIFGFLFLGLVIGIAWGIGNQGRAGAATTFYMIGWAFWIVLVPVGLIALGIGISDEDNRRNLIGDAVVDVDTLAPDVIAPIKPYLDNFKQTPPWRRTFRVLEFEWEIRARPGRWVTQQDIKRMYYRHGELVAAAERACRGEIAALDALDTRDLAAGRSTFVHTMTDEERGLLELRLKVSADLQARQLLAEREREIEALKREAVEAAAKLEAREMANASLWRLLRSDIEAKAHSSSARPGLAEDAPASAEIGPRPAA